MKPGRVLLIIFLAASLGLASSAGAQNGQTASGQMQVTGITVGAGPRGVLGAPERRTHTVQSGETLWGIAQRYYGDQSLWPKLWEVNKYNTTNPNRLSVGDVLTIYPLETLLRSKAPPAPPPMKMSLYDRGEPYDMIFPKYFSFVADPSGIGGTGIHRIKVKKRDPITNEVIVTYDEVRDAGEIISSEDRGTEWYDYGRTMGRLMMVYNDTVMVRFTEDVAKILDSATHEDPDPYFREFPIYGYGEEIWAPDPRRVDYGDYLGSILKYKGNLKVVARVETTTPVDLRKTEATARLRTSSGRRVSGRVSDLEPVSYVCRITYSERPILIGDRVLLFKSLHPGPDRETSDRKLHSAGSYRPVGP